MDKSLGIFEGQLGLFVLIVAAAVLGKTLGTALFYVPLARNWREGLVIGAGMNGRGGVDIVIIAIALKMGILSQSVFSILVFMALLTTAVVPVVLKHGIAWLRRSGELVQTGEKRTGTVIVGAGPLARSLTRLLNRTEPVTLVDSNKHHCVVSKSEGLKTICGSALQEQILREADAGRAERLIAMTPNIEINTLASRLARDVFEIPEILLLQTEDESSERTSLLKHLGAQALFAGKVDLEEWNYRIGHGKVNRSQIKIERTESATTYAARIAKELSCLPLAVLRGSEYLPFHDDIELLETDQAFLICAQESPAAERDRFDEIISDCPFLDLEKTNSAADFFEIAASLLSANLDADKESLARLFVQSETWSSTVVAPGLAIPHILLTGNHPFGMLVARSRRGIYFPGQDDPVHIIFVLVSTRAERNFHLRALSAIAQIALDESFEKKWMTAGNVEELREMILGADRRRYPIRSTTGTGRRPSL